MNMRWLDWAKQIQAIAQTGLAYGRDVYDIERFEQLRELSVEIMSHYTEVSPEKLRTAFASDEGYATPKVDIRAVIIEDGRILMVKEKADGAWSLPGGWADIGLSPFQIAAKEVREEAGYEVEAERLLAVLDKQFHNHPPDAFHIYKLFIACRIVGGSASGGTETSEVGFFGPEELPELSVSRNTAEQIHLMFRLYADPGLPVVCD
ncbi:NUDIX hydrolase [Gorillibacterium sp. sgz5001074]|uniref:NUDIX hydrolase n=1 Tax=Gorillibacterium sp. sgz5001074 TaxID=3446695 RepID=UPI003F6660EE